jgi:hypothetical protein
MEEPIKIPEKDKFVRNCPGPRYKVISGPGGHYVYDYKSLDVVRKDGKFFMGKEPSEAREFLQSLNEEAPLIER